MQIHPPPSLDNDARKAEEYCLESEKFNKSTELSVESNLKEVDGCGVVPDLDSMGLNQLMELEQAHQICRVIFEDDTVGDAVAYALDSVPDNIAVPESIPDSEEDVTEACMDSGVDAHRGSVRTL